METGPAILPVKYHLIALKFTTWPDRVVLFGRNPDQNCNGFAVLCTFLPLFSSYDTVLTLRSVRVVLV